MNVTRVLLGGPDFPTRRMGLLVGVTMVCGVGWLPFFGRTEPFLPGPLAPLVLFGLPALVAVGAVATLTIHGEGLLFGWLVGTAALWGFPAVMFFDAHRKTGEGALVEIVLVAGLWSSVLAVMLAVIGVVLGVVVRLRTRLFDRRRFR